MQANWRAALAHPADNVRAAAASAAAIAFRGGTRFVGG